jgi:hypothetical protein
VTPLRVANLLPLVGIAIVAACSSSRRIDGTSAASFERSVAMLQNDLPSRHRDDFDMALAVTWMRAAALDTTDVDGDGDTDYFDARAIADNVGELLAAIRRGDFVTAIEEGRGAAAAPAYFRQLDNLGYDGVIELAGELELGSYLAEVRRQRTQAVCAQAESAPVVRGFGGRISSKCDR